MNIVVVGSGYVGLVTGTCLAEAGNNVICVDIDEAKINRMKAGEVPIYEPDLDVYFERNVREGRLAFSTDLAASIDSSKVIFLALPTPEVEDGSADLKYVLGVADQLGHLIKHYTVVVNKSTVPVGTAAKVRAKIAENCKTQFDVVSNPEFLREGFAVNDFMKPDRIVVGSSSERASEIMRELYEPFVRQGNPIFFMDESSSEMTKYAANAFLATKITFINEIANLCEILGANVDQVRLGIGADERIGKRFLLPGIGYGGSCFPKDVKALAHMAEHNNYEPRILKAVDAINKSQKLLLVDKVKAYFKNNLKGKTFALWGLAFKPDTDDIREAPSLNIIKSLIGSGAKIVAFDSEARANVEKAMGGQPELAFADSSYGALKGADALLIATEWKEFQSADVKKIKSLLKEPVIFDGRNIYDLKHMKASGFHYESIGRPVVTR